MTRLCLGDSWTMWLEFKLRTYDKINSVSKYENLPLNVCIVCEVRMLDTKSKGSSLNRGKLLIILVNTYINYIISDTKNVNFLVVNVAIIYMAVLSSSCIICLMTILSIKWQRYSSYQNKAEYTRRILRWLVPILRIT